MKRIEKAKAFASRHEADRLQPVGFFAFRIPGILAAAAHRTSMRTFYAYAADLVVAFHFAYVAFVVFGLLLTLVGVARRWQWVRNPWFRGVHLATILIVVAEAWLGIVCPLTNWEQQLRRLAGQTTYRGDFVGRWLHEVLFFDLPPWAFTTIYSLFGLAVIATWVFAPPGRRSSKPAGCNRTASSTSQGNSRNE